jgi:hypothetical protein
MSKASKLSKLSSAQRAALMDATHGLLLCSTRTSEALAKRGLADSSGGCFMLTAEGRAIAHQVTTELATRSARVESR